MSADSIRERFESERDEADFTSLIDVAFLILIFFMCLPFKTLDGKLAAFLPTEKGLNPTPEKPPELFFIKVHIVGRKEKERVWGDPKGLQSKVQMPTEVLFKFPNGDTTDKLTDVAGYIRRLQSEAKKLPDAEVRGEIKAGHKVPHKFIIAVLNKFAEANLEKVDFYGTEIPKKKTLDAPILPYPKKAYVTQGD
ncbi:MAG: ExbD/TolR family protein [Planctomycetota bacterium]|jgi:biopolymer transport protein ExbD